MKQLRIYAPIKGPEGYSLFARDLIIQLHKQGVNVALEEFLNWGPWQIPLSNESHNILGKCLQTKLLPQKDPVVNLNICLPEQAKTAENMYNINYTMFEVDRIPENWVNASKSLDKVIVPTEHNKWVFSRSGVVENKIGVLPIGYDETRFNPEVEPLPLKTKEGKNILDFHIRFLAICEITNRKNFWGTLMLFHKVAEAIGPENCCLMLKVGNYSSSMPLDEHVKAVRKQWIDAGFIKDLKYNVFNYVALIPEEVHPAFLKIGTHYISTSFGEGWDLTAMQAAACGLHVIVPHHTAYSCWLDNTLATLLPIAQKASASMDGTLSRMYQGADWIQLHLPEAINIVTSNIIDSTLWDRKKENCKEKLKALSWKNIIPKYLGSLNLQ